MPVRIILIPMVLLAFSCVRLSAEVLYSTDFSDYQSGALEGQNGWERANEEPGTFTIEDKTLVISGGSGGRIKLPLSSNLKTVFYGFDLTVEQGNSRAESLASLMTGPYLRTSLAILGAANSGAGFGLNLTPTGGGGRPQTLNFQPGLSYRVVAGGDAGSPLSLWASEDPTENEPYQTTEEVFSGTVDAFSFVATSGRIIIGNLVIATSYEEAADASLAKTSSP